MPWGGVGGGPGSSVGGESGDNGRGGGNSGWGAGSLSVDSGGSYTIGFNRTENTSGNGGGGGPSGPTANGGNGGSGGTNGGANGANPHKLSNSQLNALTATAKSYIAGKLKNQFLKGNWGAAVKEEAAKIQSAAAAAKAAATKAVTPAAKPATTPAAKPATTPAAKPTTTPAAKPVTTPAAKPATQPATQPATNQAAAQQAQQAAAQQAAAQKAQQAAAQKAQQAAAAAKAAQQAAAQKATQAAQQAAAQKAAAAKAAADKAAAAATEKAYQDNLAKVRERAQDIGANSIFGTGNLESNRQYSAALQGLRPDDQKSVADAMSNARETARAANQKAQEAERDKAVEQATAQSNNGSRIGNAISQAYSALTGFIENPLGNSGGQGTVGGTLANGAKWGMRGAEVAGPAGGVLGFLGGMVANNVDKAELAETLRGYNPNGLGGVTSAGDLAKQAQDVRSPLWNQIHGGNQAADRGGNTGTGGNTGGNTENPNKPVDKQANAAVKNLLPQSAKNAVDAGQTASNQYLRALRGRYAKYMLSTGAEGSGTSLLQRTAGGQGALGGTSGRLLYQTGGNG